MNKKVLVADDSLTIQKVISITLANESYDLISCHNEDELLVELVKKPDLILLDFNLSEAVTGYDLIQKILEISQHSKVLVMLGTFDNIDASLLDKLGVADRIIKPFESTKFIQKCRNILSTIEEPDSSSVFNEDFSESEEGDIVVDRDDDSAWSIQSPEIKINDVTSEENSSDTLAINANPLQAELSGWGMEVPGIIGGGVESVTNSDLFPPKISTDSDNPEFSSDTPFELEETGAFTIPQEILESGPKIPKKSDLDYPSISLIQEEINSQVDIVNNQGEVVNKPDDDFENTELIKESYNEQSPEEFWSVDETEGETNNDESNGSAEYQVEDVDFNSYDQEIKSEIKAESLIPEDQGELVNQVLESLKPMVENLVKQFCQKEIERIAWEVIPDLAENLIRKEIKEISDSTQELN